MGKYVNGVYVPDEEEYNKWTHPKGNVEEVQPVVEPYKHQNTTLNKTTQVTEPYKPTTEPGLQSWDQVLGKQRAADMGLVPEQYGKPNQAAVSTYAPKMRVTPQDAELANSMAVEAQEKRNMFRVAPTADQAKMVGAAPLSENEVAARAQQLERDAIKREQQQKAIDPNDPKAGLEAINANWTSKEDEEKYRKASVARQRIMAVADALRHIGNIYHTAKYAPSQKFNSPVELERARYQQEKGLRDKANERIMTYQMAKQKLDNDQNRWEADYGLKVADAARKAGATEAQIKNMQDRLAEQRRMNDLNHGLNKEKFAWQKERGDRQDKELARHHRVSEGQNAQRINLQKQKFEWQKSGGGNGSNVPPLDTPNGKIQPSGRNYGNQLLQMWYYAKDNNLVSESDVQKALREAGFGNETPDNVKRQQVLSLLRTNKLLGDYATNRLGWSYGGASGGMNLGLDEDDDMDLGLD